MSRIVVSSVLVRVLQHCNRAVSSMTSVDVIGTQVVGISMSLTGSLDGV